MSNVSTLGLQGGAYLNAGLRQPISIKDLSTDVINTFNGLGVVFYSPSGEQIATLTAGRGDGEKLEAKLEMQKYGNLMNFTISVLRNLEIPFFNGMNVRFFYQNFPFAYGYIDVIPSTDQNISTVELQGKGYIAKLMDKKVSETYTSQTISQIIADLGTSYFLALGINYNGTKVNAPAITVSSATWDDKNIVTIIEDLIAISNSQDEDIEYIYGVDEQGDFYFKGVGTDENMGSYFEGYNYQSPETQEDAESIVNQVQLYRTTSGDNKATEYVNTYSDATSQDKYGLYERKVTIADYVDTTTAGKIANGIITEWKDPKTRITVNNLEITGVLPFGYYNITNKRQDQKLLVSDFSTASEWDQTLTNSSISVIDTNVLSGRQCYQWTLNNSLNEYISKSVEYYMPTKIKMYIRQSTAGEYISMSVSGKKRSVLSNLTESGGDNLVTNDSTNLNVSVEDSTVLDSVNINVPVANEWIDVELDLTGWFRIDTITLTIIDNGSNTVLIDRMDIYTNSYVDRRLSLEKISYLFGVNTVKCENAVFGKKKLSLTEKLDDINKKNNIPYDIFSKQ